VHQTNVPSTVAKQHRCNAAVKPLWHELNGAEPSTRVHRFGITRLLSIYQAVCAVEAMGAAAQQSHVGKWQ
jgi:hypothetical protein